MDNEPATKADLKAAELRMQELMEALETKLLIEFRKWGVPIQSAIKVHQTYAIGFDARLSLVEERLNDLERR